MKKLIIASAVLLLTGCNSLNRLFDHDHTTVTDNRPVPMEAQPIPPRVFVVGGQSNAVSYIRGYDGQVLQYSPSGKVQVTDPRTARWEDLVTVTKDNPWDVSIAWFYCGEILSARDGREVRFINTAQGGTSSEQWAIDPDKYNRVLRAVSDFKADAVLWHLGETDDQLNFTEDQSYTNLKNLILAVRRTNPRTKFIMALNSAGTDPNRPIRRAQQRLINEGYALQGPDTDILRTNSSIMSSDGLHFVGDGFRQFGEMWANSIQNYL